MSSKPLVTVICLCYNHRRFIKVAVQSILDQTYPHVELIIIDDASTDGSQEEIEQIVVTHPNVKYFPMSKNQGNCKAFNLGLSHAKGEYIIDHAADDILNPTRIEEGVRKFDQLGIKYGVNFTAAEIIDEKGNKVGNFYKRTKKNGLKPKVSEGDIYADLLERYFICPPTLMARKEVYNSLNGYDETLAYEDFDFLLRAARSWKFFFIDKQLVKRRIVENSMSTQQYKKGSKQLQSTYEICKKAKSLNKNSTEDRALKKRVLYEGRKTLEIGELKLVLKYIQLYLSI